MERIAEVGVECGNVRIDLDSTADGMLNRDGSQHGSVASWTAFSLHDSHPEYLLEHYHMKIGTQFRGALKQWPLSNLARLAFAAPMV